MSPLMTMLFAAAAAFFYMTSSWIVQSWGLSPYLVLVPALLLTLAVGARFEMQILRDRRLVRTIFAVLAVEATATAAIAVAVMGDAYTIREAAGALAVFSGIALVGMAPATRQG